MGKRFFKWASLLAVSLAFMWMAVPLTAFAYDTLPMTIGAMGEEDAHAVIVSMTGDGEATIAVSVNGVPQEASSAQAKQGDVVRISVTLNEPTSVGITNFSVFDSSEASVKREYSEESIDGTIYFSHVYTFTMPDSNVTASCVLGGVSKLAVYCALGWEDFDFTIANSVGDSMMPNEQKLTQKIPCRIYYLATGGYNFTLRNTAIEKVFDSGVLNLNPGNFNLNWNQLTVAAEPAIVEGLGSFGTAGCVCVKDNGVEIPLVSNNEEESGLCTVTFLLRGKGDDGSGSTNYSVTMTPKDERCSAVWASGESGKTKTINIGSNIKTKYTESLKWRASDLMEAQGQAITELGDYVDPANYLEAQQAEIAQAIAAATEAIKAAETEEAVAEQLASAKQALDAVETAEQAQAAAAPVAQAIAALPAADALTAENADAVKAARAAYDALTAAEKAAVGEDNVLKLESAEAAVEAAIAAEKAKADAKAKAEADAKAKADAAAKAAALAAAVNVNKPAFTAADAKKVSDLGATTITLGPKVKKIAKGAFKGTKITTIIVKTKKLKKKSVKGSLKGSSVKTVKVQVGKKKANKKYVKKYKKIFTKKNAGKKAKVK